LQRVHELQQGYEETLRRYTPRGYRGRITLLINEQAYERDRSLGWSSLATGGIDIYRVQGDHESYIRDYVQAVALQLRACLEKAEKESRISSGPERSGRDHFSQTKTRTWKHEVDFRFG